MKITGLDVHRFTKLYDQPISNGKYTYNATNIVICQVHTDEGISGVGWTHGKNIVFNTIKRLEDYVKGEDPFNVERIWNKMYLPKIFGRKGLTTRAISAVDIALWDIKGKVAGKPLYQLLGGYRDEVPVYIAGGYYETGKSNELLQEEMKDNIAKGVKAIKMKIGRLSIKEDVERIKAVQNSLSNNVDILVDANNSYSRNEALRMGRELDKLGVYWFEEPIACDDFAGLAKLGNKIDTPIASGENEYTRYGFRDMIDSGSVDIINADAQVLGGITEWKKVADFASAHHILVAPHGDQEIHVHLVASISNGLIVEYYDTNTNVLRDRMFKNKLKLKNNGMVSPLNKPGIGVELNLEAIEEFRVE
jgi:L-alanine-DL-glutamate epimerase-like enolase superfamily enzyme